MKFHSTVTRAITIWLWFLLLSVVHASTAALSISGNRIWEISNVGYDTVHQTNIDYDNVVKASSARALDYDEHQKRSADVVKRRFAAERASMLSLADSLPQRDQWLSEKRWRGSNRRQRKFRAQKS